MDAIDIADGGGGHGAGRYAEGLITLPDGAQRGIETVTHLAVRERTPGSRWPGAVVGGLRDALPADAGRLLPLRLALSTVRAGLGAIEDGLQPDAPVEVEITFADGTAIRARMAPASAAAIRRDARLVRDALARAARVRDAAEPGESGAGPASALTSIFHYEKRRGRLRRVPASGGDRTP